MKYDFGTWKRHYLAVPFELFMFVTAIIMVAQRDWLHVATSLFTFVVSFIPLWAEKWFKIRLPLWLQTTYVLFIFMSMFMGEVLHMYGQFFWWDDLAHTVYGIIMAFGVVLWLELMKARKSVKLPAVAQVLFVFSFVVCVAALWEIFEFISDQWFGTWSQNDSLFDTMLDMIEGTLGCLVVCGWYVWYLHLASAAWLQRTIQHFLKTNP